MKKKTKQALAKELNTSRSKLDRLLDPQNVAVSLDTITSRCQHARGEADYSDRGCQSRLRGVGSLPVVALNGFAPIHALQESRPHLGGCENLLQEFCVLSEEGIQPQSATQILENGQAESGTAAGAKRDGAS